MAEIIADNDCPAMTHRLKPTASEERGRKRQKSEDVTYQPAVHNPSGGSTTLRGRGRRRSASGTSFQSDDTTKPPPRTESAALRHYQRKLLPQVIREKKRSQSPSRSRSGVRSRTPRRRRQRTTTRSRSHDPEMCKKRILQKEERENEKGKGIEP